MEEGEEEEERKPTKENKVKGRFNNDSQFNEIAVRAHIYLPAPRFSLPILPSVRAAGLR